MNEPYIYNRNSTTPQKGSFFSSIKDTLTGRNKFATMAAVFGLMLAITITTQQVLTQQDSRSRASFTNGASLALKTTKSTFAAGEEFDLSVFIESPQYAITGADIKIDVPAQFEVLSVTNPGYLSKTIVPSTILATSVNFVFASEIGEQKKGSGILANLKVRAKQSGIGEFRFNLLSSEVTAYSIENQNILNKTTPLALTVSGTATGPTVTPSSSLAALSLTSTKSTFKVGEQFTVDVGVNSQQYALSAAHIGLLFPSNLIQIQSITLGTTFPVRLVAPIIGTGTANFSVGSSISAPFKGTGSIATVTARTLAAGQGQVTFDPAKTQLAAVAEIDRNVAGQLNPFTFIIEGSGSVTTPFPTSIVPSPTPTPKSLTPTPTSTSQTPTVSFSKPVNGSQLPRYGSVQVSVTAGSANGIKEIKVYANSKLLRTCLTATSCSFWWSPTTGTQTLQATASNTSNPPQFGTSTITVTR